MINPDILRVMAELYTFTAEDLAAALDCPVGTVGGQLSGWVRGRYLVRFKCDRTLLYALSERGQRIVDKLPAIDPGERCLLLETIPSKLQTCPDCGGIVTARSCNEQFMFAGCDYCFANWYSSLQPYGWSDWYADDIPF